MRDTFPTSHDEMLTVAIGRRPGAAGDAERPTGTGCSSWRPTAPSRPNSAASPLSRRAGRSRSWKRKIAVYLRRIQGDAWRLAAVPRRRLRHSATVKAYFALKMIGDTPDAPHMDRAREAMRAARRRRARQRVHALPVGALRHRAVARGAGNAGRDHAAAEMVSVPSRQDLLLGRTVIVPLLVLMAKKPRARERQGRRHRRVISRAAAIARADAEGAAAEGVVVLVLPRHRQRAARGRAAVSRSAASSAPSTARSPGSASTERRGRPRRDISGDGQQRDDVRRAGFPEDHPQRAIARNRSRSSRRPGPRGLLPALRLADLGYRACLPCAAGSGRRARGGAGKAGPRLARAEQVLDVRGDWIAQRPDVRPGGWAFQYANPHYPDVDDTAVVAMAMDRVQQS